jgi:hypothetical protein
MKAARLTRMDWFAAALLGLITLALFGAGARGLGFYYDDGDVLFRLPQASLHELFHLMGSSVRGRNLLIFWQYWLCKAVGNPARHLAALHLLQSALDGMIAAGFYLLLRRLSLPAAAALLAAGLFSVWPNHGESHFWLTEASPILISSLLAMLFLASSLLLAAAPRRPGWLWLLDAAAFGAALFTYDQIVLVLVVFAAVRAIAAFRSAKSRASLLACHLPHAACMVFYAWLRRGVGPGSFTPWRRDTVHQLGINLAAAGSYTLGRLWFRQVLPLYSKVTWTDWLLAAAAGAIITLLAISLLRRVPASADGSVRPGLGTIFGLALLFYIAASLPIWVWYVAPRHHAIPSLGLFAAGAAALACLLQGLTRRWSRLGIVLALGLATVVLAAADRGESRYWEEAFAAKKQLFDSLQDQLRAKDVVVFENFPFLLGPAYFMTPHDAVFAAALLQQRRTPLAGSIGGEPAPGGIFLYNHPTYGPSNFRYYAADRLLVVRFLSWKNGRAVYQSSPRGEMAYDVISSQGRPGGRAAFQVRHVSARRAGEDVTVDLDFAAGLRPQTYLAATFAFFYATGFHRWSRPEPWKAASVIPVLLSDPGPHPRSGNWEWRQTLRLHCFPKTNRMLIEFFETSRENAPAPLDRAVVPLEP